MRTRMTNLLQGVVMLAGVVYLVMGLAFLISPYRTLKVFAFNVGPSGSASADSYAGGESRSIEATDLSTDEWLKQIVNDEIISPLYYLFRVFALLMAVCGLSLVMPLFDPLRYRGLIYAVCLIFPFIATVSSVVFIAGQESMRAELSLSQGQSHILGGHPVMTVVAAVFALISFCSAVALMLTRKQSREGKE